MLTSADPHCTLGSMCDGDASEHARDQDQPAAARLRELIAAGLDSGEARPVTDHDVAEIRDRALGEVDRRVARSAQGNEPPP